MPSIEVSREPAAETRRAEEAFVTAQAAPVLAQATSPLARMPQDPAAVIALQRGAGNAAVAGLLMRRRNLPADPTSLSDYAGDAETRRDIRFDTDVQHHGRLQQYFIGQRSATRSGYTVNLRFGGPLLDPAAASPPADAEQTLQQGLGNLAFGIFNLLDVSTGTVPQDSTLILDDIDPSQWHGRRGRYRLTCVARPAAGRGATATPASTDVLVEYLGGPRAALRGWSAIPATEQQALTARFSRLGGIQANDPLGISWNDDHWGKVLQVLASIPENVLYAVRNTTFERGLAATGPNGEAGEYRFRSNPFERKIILYQDAFSGDEQLRRVLIHELGHALTGRPTEDSPGAQSRHATREYQQAAQRDGGLRRGITTYSRTDWNEHFSESYSLYRSEPDTFRLLRPSTAAYFDRLESTLPAAPAAQTAPAGSRAG